MEENANNDILIIMQKVLDKLKHLSEATDKNNAELNGIFIQNNTELYKVLEKICKSLVLAHESIGNLGNKVIETIEKNKTIPNVNNYTEYSLLGSKSQFKPLTLIIMLFSLVLIWSTIKYVPPYLIEYSDLKKEKEEYLFFYNYVYLSQFKNEGKTSANEILNKYRENDTLLMKEYHNLINVYEKEIRKQQLEEELKLLENHDR